MELSQPDMIGLPTGFWFVNLCKGVENRNSWWVRRKGETVGLTTCFVLKVLGVTIRNDHVDTITSKVARRLYLLSQLRRACIISDYMLAFYCSVILLVLEFSCQLFHRSLPKYFSDDIERIQRCQGALCE